MLSLVIPFASASSGADSLLILTKAVASFVKVLHIDRKDLWSISISFTEYETRSVPLAVAVSSPPVCEGATELVPDIYVVGSTALAGSEAGDRPLPQAVQWPRPALAGHDRSDTSPRILHSSSELVGSRMMLCWLSSSNQQMSSSSVLYSTCSLLPAS